MPIKAELSYRMISYNMPHKILYENSFALVLPKQYSMICFKHLSLHHYPSNGN